MSERSRLIAAWAAYALFVVYGSLVPLDFVAQPPGEALARFGRIPFLDLGVASRADWIANGVLYAPLGALSAGVARRLRLGVAAPWLAFAGCAALAVGIEFAQLFFPPRTVSQNDLLAEFIGAGLGVALSPLAAAALARLREGGRLGFAAWGPRLLELYALAWLALALFPYDLLLSGPELAAKLASHAWGWLLAGEPGLARGLKLVVELALALPLGALLALRWRAAPLAAALAGAAVGVALEVAQLLLASGVSQGLSVAARAAGFGLGAALVPRLARGGFEAVADLLRRSTALLLAAWLPLLLAASGWFSGRWHGLDGAAETWAGLRLLPFYYHYYTTEAVALASAGSAALAYLPLAAVGWARRWRPGATLLAVLAAAALVEAGKLFVAGQRPDPTNLLIATGAAAAALALMRAAQAAAVRPAPASPRAGMRPLGAVAAASATSATPATPVAIGRGDAAAGAASATPPAAGASPAAAPGARLAWLAVAALALGGATLFAPFALPLALLLGAAFAAVAWRPLLALAIVPAALPVLDLAPWTGRVFVDEFDLLLAGCAAVAAARTPLPAAAGRAPLALRAAFALLALSLAVSTLRALWPPPLPATGDWWSFTSPVNALRIVKGGVEAWVVVALWRRLDGAGAARAGAFTAGMLAGLAATVAWIVVERAAFAGFLDFGAGYRVTGPFSAMHRGGAYVEGYLAIGLAFALAATLDARRAAARAAGLALLAAAAWALAVTFSRNGWVAGALALAVTAALALSRPGMPRRRSALLAAAALALVAALPVLLGPFAQQRLARSGEDLAARQAHWADALALRTPGAAGALIGEGLGRFPDLHYWRSREPVRAARLDWRRDGDGGVLRLGPGATLYLEQIVDAGGAAELRLQARLRRDAGPAALAVALCRKTLLSSRECSHATLAAADARPGEWAEAAATLAVPPGRLPLKLALMTPSAAPALELDSVSARDGDGAERLANGGFDDGLARWFFSTDVHPPWHVDSLPVALLLEQGWLGVVAWGALLVLAAAAALSPARRALAPVPAAAGALAALAASGTLNTLLDTPRFLLLALLLTWLAAAAPVAGARPQAASVTVPRSPARAP